MGVDLGEPRGTDRLKKLLDTGALFPTFNLGTNLCPSGPGNCVILGVGCRSAWVVCIHGTYFGRCAPRAPHENVPGLGVDFEICFGVAKFGPKTANCAAEAGGSSWGGARSE